MLHDKHAIDLRSFGLGAVTGVAAGLAIGILAAVATDTFYYAWMSYTGLSRERTCEDIAGATDRRTRRLQENPDDRDLEEIVASLTRAWADLCLRPRY